jgi:hypothetical protein
MAYIYLTDMFKQIDIRLTDAASTLDKLESDSIERQFQEGRIKALSDFKAFLENEYVPKLPRRIRQSYYSVKDKE